ncbi:MAG: hypothetical protein OXI22_12960 [Defluviicoccus sp.]|nr:hypothetical protein [Defluviicoccus sp.]MDE0384791.1 hypothetical protein [Defluviicoccus sp.]
MTPEDIVVGLVALNGGQLVGRTRLQKQAYLLDRCGAEFGLEFTYHHYGPYSFELAGGCADAAADGQIQIEQQISQQHGVPYAIFRSSNGDGASDRLGALSAGQARSLLGKMQGVSDIVLELAATIVFLRDEWPYYGKGKTDAVEETKARKSLKATEKRIEEALGLIRALGLEEAAAPAGV